MLISVQWLNRLLDPPDLTGAEAEAVLTRLGFPLESRAALPSGDERLDVEVTSNRGDCLSHIGVAREIAAATGRSLLAPACSLPTNLGNAPGALRAAAVDNAIPDHRCPIFTARLIRGVKVGPSPSWLVDALESVGQRSVNNVVDCSNYLLFELGHPTHAFDFACLSGGRVVVRMARDKEPFTALDGKAHTLTTDDMVVADAERAVGLAGVIGGLDSSVTERTRDVLLEAATWDPAHVRRSARRRNIRTDASHRYERIVDQRTTPFASARLAELILKVAGGTLEPGVAWAGRSAPPNAMVRLRPDRCRAVLGYDLPTIEMARLLTALDLDAHLDHAAHHETIRCEITPHRPDLSREIDLIEEVARAAGLDRIPIKTRIEIEARPPQNSELAARELASTLAGLGFFETVTFSFVAREDAAAWMPSGLRALSVDEERRKGEPALRPSILPSLLRCLRTNHHAGVRPESGVRLFETAAVFAEEDAPGHPSRTIEHRNLALLVESPLGDGQHALRELRGAVEASIRALAGRLASIDSSPTPPHCTALAAGSCAAIIIEGVRAGFLGLADAAALRTTGIEDSAVALAEINLHALMSHYPPRITIEPLPAFPAIERDLSLVVDEPTPWAHVAAIARESRLERLEDVSFVGVYRGKQVGPNKKSVTLRLRFRDHARTLRHEEVDPQMASLVATYTTRLGAELRK